MQEETRIQTQDFVPFTDARIYQRPVDTRDAEQPRELFFIGNVVEPEAARQRVHLKAGGMEVWNPCLRFVKHFLRKCRISPLLEDTHNPVPRETVDPNDKSYYDIPIPVGYQPPFGTTMPVGPSAMMQKRVLPGEQVHLIVNGPANGEHGTVPRGIVEIRALKSHAYKPVDVGEGLYLDAEIWRIQRAIFPAYPVLPTLIVDVRRLLNAAWEASPGLREILEDMQMSSEQFEAYARTTVKQANAHIRSIAVSRDGYVPQYTPVDLVLIEQLGEKRHDDEFNQLSQMAATGGAGLAEIKEMFAMFREASREERDAIIAAYEKKAAVGATSVPGSEVPANDATEKLLAEIDQTRIMTQAPAIDEDTMKATLPIGSPVETEKFICACGEEAKTLAGLKSHQRACDQVKTEG